jgi:hypothetical protein
MKIREMPRRIEKHLTVQRVGVETLLYDEQRHKAFCLNQSCSAIWRLSTGEQTIAKIRELASIELGIQISEEFVSFAIQELRRDGLIEPACDAEVGPPISRRTILQTLGVSGAMLLPAVAAIVAPTAAQAYSGCFDCSDDEARRASQLARERQIARMRSQQQRNASNPLNAPPDDDSLFDPLK